MVAAVEKLLQASTAANVQRADTLGRVEFVSGERKQIHAEYFYIERNFSGRLHGVGVEINVTLRGDLSDFREAAARCRVRCWRA